MSTVILVLMACRPDPEALLASGQALARTDPAGAAEPLGEACAAGLVAACDAAGALGLDDPRTGGWNERACEGGVASACARRSASPDDGFRERACTLGDGPSCLPAADAARAAGEAERAAALYATGCRLDPESASCLLAARATGSDLPGEGPAWPDGSPAEVSDALWARCAAHEAWGCLQLAEHVERHGGPLPAAARGDPAWLRNQACDLQLTYACAPHVW